MLCLGLTVMLAVAGSAAEEPLTVTSQEQILDYRSRVATYTGQVRATHTQFVFEAERVEVYFTEANTVDHITAVGQVNVTQAGGARQASCRTATYRAGAEIVELEQDVRYEDELGNRLQAERITIYLEEQRLEATGAPVTSTFSSLEELQRGAESGASGQTVPEDSGS
jgi:lipopolysaccharide transport protein LptA